MSAVIHSRDLPLGRWHGRKAQRLILIWLGDYVRLRHELLGRRAPPYPPRLNSSP
jgi:hypothetical protein